MGKRDRHRVRFSKESMSGEKKNQMQNQAYLMVPSSEGHALVMVRTNSQCVCVCELPLPGNKSRVIGVAGPPEGKARVMTEGGKEGQNEKGGGRRSRGM